VTTNVPAEYLSLFFAASSAASAEEIASLSREKPNRLSPFEAKRGDARCMWTRESFANTTTPENVLAESVDWALNLIGDAESIQDLECGLTIVRHNAFDFFGLFISSEQMNALALRKISLWLSIYQET